MGGRASSAESEPRSVSAVPGRDGTQIFAARSARSGNRVEGSMGSVQPYAIAMHRSAPFVPSVAVDIGPSSFACFPYTPIQPRSTSHCVVASGDVWVA
jgi:hypothetical protein